MGRFDDPVLKAAVYKRDNYRCRWCGDVRAYAYDAHHIRYRRGSSDDVISNLITLCRDCHDFVHASHKIPKETAQRILFQLVAQATEGNLANTGLFLWRRERRNGDTGTGPGSRGISGTRGDGKISRFFGPD